MIDENLIEEVEYILTLKGGNDVEFKEINTQIVNIDNIYVEYEIEK